MNPLPLLRVPWFSAHRSMRWMMVFVLACCSAGAVAIGVFAPGPGQWKGVAGLLGLGLFFLWAFFLSTTLLLAIDARQLRVPGIQRQIIRSLLLCGVLTISLPAVLLGMLGEPVAPVVILLALASVLGVTFALMPRYLAALLGMTPSLLNALWYRCHLPGPDDPHFTAAGAVSVVALLLPIIWRWRQLVRAGANQPQGWSSPMVLQLRNGSWGHWSGIGENRQIRLRPVWLQPDASLTGVGPAMPRKALRIALGGWYMPQTLRSYARQLGLLLSLFALPMLGFVAIARFGRSGSDVSTTLTAGLVGSLGALTVIAGPMVGAFSLAWLGKRWQRVNGELPLLALLPAFGDPACAKRELLRAGLGLPLCLHGLLAVLVVAAMLHWHQYAQPLSFLLLAQLVTATVTVSALLNLFGGLALPLWAMGLTLAATFLLTVLSAMLPAMAWGHHPVGWAGAMLPPLGLGWLLLGGAMIWLGRRGWRGLMLRPHPFLLN
ncbi:hypothetical protein B0E46_12510 [Rhodanobacter sp. B04]|uniref:hypothetical protein n=1 Tax=Rhodanobacter sp. B04 TaxID=1945860 RepID=UPI0009857FE2|nr:hypothetical protein [Rhodanobacter sp. B04]OOG62462.1 hypothetical protein B0E46_12510 [Rhodanobacter sp. B04]